LHNAGLYQLEGEGPRSGLILPLELTRGCTEVRMEHRPTSEIAYREVESPRIELGVLDRGPGKVKDQEDGRALRRKFDATLNKG
jgi:hypothetical protein